MRSQLLLFPVAIVAAQPAAAATLMSVEQSQALMFPGAALTQNFVKMTEDQYLAIEDKSGIKFWNHDIKAWKVSTGGWFLIDRVLARDDFITYALALDKDGNIAGVEILDCMPHYNLAVPAWLKQFHGQRHDSPALVEDIKVLSGATLSSKAVREGVKRLMATYEIVLAPLS